MGGAVGGSNSDAVGSPICVAGLLQHGEHFRITWQRRFIARFCDERVIFAVKVTDAAKTDFLDVSADAAFGKRERHPWFKVREHARMRFRVFHEVEVKAVCPRNHQVPQPIGAALVVRFQLFGVEEETLPQILPDPALAFSFRKSAQRDEIVCFDAIEVVFALRVDHAEDGISIGRAVDMRNAPIITGDVDGFRFGDPASAIS